MHMNWISKEATVQRTLTALLAIGLLAPVAAAQQEEAPQDSTAARGMMGGQGGMRGMMGGQGGMQGMGGQDELLQQLEFFSPEKLTEHKDLLNLTEDQVGRLEAIHDEKHEAHMASHADEAEHRAGLEEALAAATQDPATIKTHAEGLMNAMHAAYLASITASVQARAVLDAAQTARVEGWIDAEHRMGGGGMGMGGGGMGMGGGGMQGGMCNMGGMGEGGGMGGGMGQGGGMQGMMQRQASPPSDEDDGSDGSGR
jgi:hypothetical protein